MEKSVFELVKEIGDYSSIYAALGCGHIVGSVKEKAMHPCPKTGNPADKKSTKFRLHKDFDINGKCIHNDVNEGHYMGVIDYVMWMYDESPLEAAMRICDEAGLEYRRGTGSRPPQNKTPIKTVTPEEIAARNAKVVETGKRNLALVDRVWSESVSITDPRALSLLDKYLVHRGLPEGHVNRLPKNIRVSFNLMYPGAFREENKPAWYAGCLIPMLDARGKRVSFHRHYFEKNSGHKVNEEKRKLLMNLPWSLEPGSKLEYDQPKVFTDEGVKCAVIGVGEGFETMEAVRAGTNMPVQPMYSSSLLQGYQPPVIEGVNNEDFFIFIFADRDRKEGGEKAAKILAQRLTEQGFTVDILLPPIAIPSGKKSVDWLDAYNELDKEAFPSDVRLT